MPAGSLVGPDPARTRPAEVFRALVRADLRDRMELSPAGVVKWVLEPIVYTGIYFLLIGVMLRRGQRDYSLFLLCALLPWRYVQGVVGGSMGMLRGYSNIISARVLPRRTLPLVAVVSEGVNLLVTLLVLAPLMAYYRIPPSLALLWLPLVIAVLALLVTGPAYLAATFGLYFPDYRATAQSLVRVGLLLSTGLVASRDLPGDLLRRAIRANPVSGIFDSVRDVVMLGRSPTLWHLAYPALVGASLLIVGLAVYGAREPEFAKEV